MKCFYYSIISAITIVIGFTSGGCAKPPDFSIVSDDDRSSVYITIYNNGLGLVKETRVTDLVKGLNRIHYTDVASRIIPTSVHVKSLSSPNLFSLHEQNYEYDLITQAKLLDKYVGKEINLIFKSSLDGSEEEKTAILLSNNNGPVYKIDDQIHLGFPGRVILPKIPKDLLARPTLVWLVDNQGKAKQDIEVSYLTNGISWKCDYVLVLSKDDSSADISSWVTIDNKSGTAYKDASVKLVAGDVRREQRHYQRFAKSATMEMDMAGARPNFEEESFFEYHLYTLQRKTSVKNNQTKQILLFETTDVPITKKFILHGQKHFYSSNRSHIQTIPVNVYLDFKNSEQNNLGMPMPKGLIRVYKVDKQDMLQFAGENSIKHTPKDEKITLKIGEAFDVKAERKQTDYKKIRRDVVETEWEISVRNHKDEEIVVFVQESVPGDWSVESANFPYEKKSSSVLEFSVPVEKNGESKLKYRVLVKY